MHHLFVSCYAMAQIAKCLGALWFVAFALKAKLITFWHLQDSAGFIEVLTVVLPQIGTSSSA
jgi:hypothetical protein